HFPVSSVIGILQKIFWRLGSTFTWPINLLMFPVRELRANFCKVESLYKNIGHILMKEVQLIKIKNENSDECLRENYLNELYDVYGKAEEKPTTLVRVRETRLLNFEGETSERNASYRPR
ncbi:hypothetical protein L9F63_026391, partial [Diploptera punctata]